MSSIIGRSMFRASHPLRAVKSSATAASKDADREASRRAMRHGIKKDPELYVLGAMMFTFVTCASWWLTSTPTKAVSETKIAKVHGSEPWLDNASGSGAKYQYHPRGDRSKTVDAPSALSAHIIPDIRLKRKTHDRINKLGKDISEL